MIALLLFNIDLTQELGYAPFTALRYFKQALCTMSVIAFSLPTITDVIAHPATAAAPSSPTASAASLSFKNNHTTIIRHAPVNARAHATIIRHASFNARTTISHHAPVNARATIDQSSCGKRGE